MALSLYETARLCPSCKQAVTFADVLTGECPSCKGILISHLTPRAAAERLEELKALRAALGLTVHLSLAEKAAAELDAAVAAELDAAVAEKKALRAALGLA
jgi:hypothetical protein